MSGNPLLTTASFPALRSAAGGLEIENNATLTTLELPLLEEVRNDVLRITGNPLDDLALPRLTCARTFEIGGVAGGAISAPLLAEVIGRATIAGNPGATAIDLGALAHVGDSVVSDLRIADNARVAALIAPALRTIAGQLYITNNPHLPQCQAVAIRDQLTSIAIGGGTFLSGNDEAATCP